MKNEHALLERQRAVIETRRAALEMARALYDRTQNYELTGRLMTKAGHKSPNGGPFRGQDVSRLLSLAARAGVD